MSYVFMLYKLYNVIILTHIVLIMDLVPYVVPDGGLLYFMSSSVLFYDDHTYIINHLFDLLHRERDFPLIVDQTTVEYEHILIEVSVVSVRWNAEMVASYNISLLGFFFVNEVGYKHVWRKRFCRFLEAWSYLTRFFYRFPELYRQMD